MPQHNSTRHQAKEQQKHVEGMRGLPGPPSTHHQPKEQQQVQELERLLNCLSTQGLEVAPLARSGLQIWHYLQKGQSAGRALRNRSYPCRSAKTPTTEGMRSLKVSAPAECKTSWPCRT